MKLHRLEGRRLKPSFRGASLCKPHQTLTEKSGEIPRKLLSREHQGHCRNPQTHLPVFYMEGFSSWGASTSMRSTSEKGAALLTPHPQGKAGPCSTMTKASENRCTCESHNPRTQAPKTCLRLKLQRKSESNAVITHTVADIPVSRPWKKKGRWEGHRGRMGAVAEGGWGWYDQDKACTYMRVSKKQYKGQSKMVQNRENMFVEISL